MQSGHKRHNEFYGQDGQNKQQQHELHNTPVMRDDFIRLWTALNHLVEAEMLLTKEVRLLEDKLMAVKEENTLLRNEIKALKSLCNKLDERDNFFHQRLLDIEGALGNLNKS